MNNAISYLYIFAVFPSSSGMAISGAVVGYVTGICEKNDIMIQLLIEQTDMKSLYKFLLYWIKQIVLIFHIWNKYPLPSTSTFLNSRDTRKISFYGHFIFNIDNIDKLEAVQRRATRWITRSDDDYDTRLSKLKLLSLSNRRFTRDVTFFLM